MEQKIYDKVLQENTIKRHTVRNALRAFLVGGIISLLAQGLLDLYQKVAGLEEKVSTSLMSVTIVTITAILTGVGIFDKIGQWSGAGTLIPITGFSNSMTSSALESKSEGVVLGIMTNMFKLAGAVIVAGVVSAFLSGIVIHLFR